MSTRRTLLRRAGYGMWASLWPGAAQAGGDTLAAALPHPASLATALAQALGQHKALVVMFSLHGCPYCRLVRASYLAPLRAAGQPVVQLELAASLPVLDLQGAPATHAQIARAWGVRLAPTVLFLGRRGAEAATRLEGVASPDFYGAYLQERIDTANRSVTT
jgi:hypothetical protein